MLASYATNPDKSRGRKIFELPDLYRNNFEKDRERIIHSNAFKRLEYKTQVFVNDQGDHYRNRLTHSLEAANIARIIARRLSLSEDLAECIALAHDLGHTPFGHAGEDALNECMQNYGGFCHNDFSVKLLTKLEKRYAAFDGLNLSWEVIEGIAKHNGPILKHEESKATIFALDAEINLDLKRQACAEAQIGSISDDIAYNSHDLEDAVRSGIVDIYALSEISFFNNHINELKSKVSDSGILIYELVRIFTKTLIQDVINTSSDNFYSNKINTLDDIRSLDKPIICFSSKIEALLSEVHKFLYKNFYRSHNINITSFKSKKIVAGLFNIYMDNPGLMPLEWQELLADKNQPRVISDYIAGMTDRYATKAFESIYYPYF